AEKIRSDPAQRGFDFRELGHGFSARTSCGIFPNALARAFGMMALSKALPVPRGREDPLV
ncbi:MAG: hypothetical protein ACREUD_06780, partial [Gammaproteobacteria bacterium]